MPKVSIIVPNYNHAQYLAQRLDSIFNQTFQDFEVILLDDCSTDNSVEILSSYAKDSKVSSFITNTKNSGSTFKQLSKGIALAKGEYIWIAESDDWAENEFLERTLSCLNDKIGIIYTQSYIVNENNDKLYVNTKYTDYLDKEKWKKDFLENGIIAINSFFINRNIIPNMSATLISRNEFMKVVINNDLKYIGDWFLYCQLLLRKDLCYISEPLNNYRQHSNTVRTKAINNGLREKEYYFLLNFLKGHKNISKKGLYKQFVINTKSWINKCWKIRLKMHLKIVWQFIKFFI